jgi:hypothetical protein
VAASIVVPARVRSMSRAQVAAAGARTAPRGVGLAPVVPLPFRGTAADAVAPAVPDGTSRQTPAERSTGSAQVRAHLRVVPSRGRSRVALRRRLIAMLAAVLVVGVAVGMGRAALADPADPVALGHVVLQPGETLWDIAVRSAPPGGDPRRQLDVLRRLNGFGPGALDAWTVVLVPAP